MKSHPDGIPPKVVIDFGHLNFIRPTSIVILSNFIWWMEHNGVSVEFENVVSQKPALRYLDDSGFFRSHIGNNIHKVSSPRSTTQPLLRISNTDVHGWLELTLVPWLSNRLNMTQSSFHDFKTCVSELFNNIHDHTAIPIGSIFVQHFPKENRIFIAVADWGCGIHETVRRKVPELTDHDAVIQAVQDGFSAKSRPNNQGAGLPLLLDKVVLHNQGEVVIYSHTARVRFYQSSGTRTYDVLRGPGFCPGTALEINLRTDTIEAVPDEMEDLEW